MLIHDTMIRVLPPFGNPMTSSDYQTFGIGNKYSHVPAKTKPKIKSLAYTTIDRAPPFICIESHLLPTLYRRQYPVGLIVVCALL